MKRKKDNTAETVALAARIISEACKTICPDTAEEVAFEKEIFENKEKLFVQALTEQQKILYEELTAARIDYHDKFLSAYKSRSCKLD